VFDAVGVRLRSVPFTPDKVKAAMKGAGAARLAAILAGDHIASELLVRDRSQAPDSATRLTRSGMRAAQARAQGAPPDTPTIANRPSAI